MGADTTKERILEAAFAEFAAYGVAGARVDRIAENARCNKNLIYVYFTNKETLFTTVLKMQLWLMTEELAFSAENLPEFAGRVFDFAMAHSNVMRLLTWATLEGTTQFPPFRVEAHEAKIAATEQAMRDGKISGRFSAAFIVNTVIALANSWSPALPFATSIHPESAPPLAELRASVVRAVALITEGQE